MVAQVIQNISAGINKAAEDLETAAGQKQP
jgi:hypothetical protein